jgi:hypothetical protein
MVEQPTPAEGNRRKFPADRALLVLTLVLALFAAAASGFNGWRFARFEQEFKRLELEQRRAQIPLAEQLHLKHDFTFRLSQRSAPNKDAPGTYLITFTGKLTNNGKRPFKLHDSTISTWLGVPQLPAEKQKAITIKEPSPKDTYLKWEQQDRFATVRPAEGTLLNPQQEANIHSIFLVTAAEETFFGMGYHVYLEYAEEPTTTKSIAWDTFRMFDLRDAEARRDGSVKEKRE